jgi:hypothetical protein
VPLGGLTINDATTINPLSLGQINVNGNVDITTGREIIFNSPLIASGGLTAAATGGDIQIGSGANLTANGAGNALTLAGTNLLNGAGTGALSTPSGRWLVYSTSPAGSTENGLTATAGSATPRLYNRTFAANSPTSISEPGNHLIYNSQPALNVTANGATRVYGDANPAFTFLTSGFLTDDGVTDTLANAALTGALTTSAVVNSPVSGSPYAITQGTLVSSSGYSVNYTGANMTVTPRSITATAGAGQSKIYGNADPVFAFSITSGNLVGADTLAGAAARAAGENIGAYAINQGTLANANYAITFAGNSFGITQRPITVTANAGQNKVYGDADPAFTYAVTAGNLVGPDTLSGALARTAGENVGAYAINQGTLANTNYGITFAPDNFAITQRPITVTANAGQNKVYGNVDPTLAYAVTTGNLVGVDTLGGALARAAGENVGAYAINQGTLANGNYAIAFSANNFGITKRPITVTAGAGQNKVYGSVDPALTYAVTTGNLVAADTLGGTLSRAGGENAGAYAINQGTLANANYAITYAGNNFSITPAPLTVTADNKTRLEGNPNPAFTASFAGFVLGETPTNLSGALAFSTPANTVSPAGNYAITPSGLSSTNYSIAYVSGFLQVTSTLPSPLPTSAPTVQPPPDHSALYVAVESSSRVGELARQPDEPQPGCRRIASNFYDCR